VHDGHGAVRAVPLRPGAGLREPRGVAAGERAGPLGQPQALLPAHDAVERPPRGRPPGGMGDARAAKGGPGLASAPPLARGPGAGAAPRVPPCRSRRPAQESGPVEPLQPPRALRSSTRPPAGRPLPGRGHRAKSPFDVDTHRSSLALGDSTLVSRRLFLSSAALAPFAAGGPSGTGGGPPGDRPVVVGSLNGLKAAEFALARMRAGADPLDAIVAGVNLVENDPKDMSVGYGGIPNEDGVVQLDSCVMHGPTARAGAVAALEGIKNPSSVAKAVMETTDHILLVGPGARRFAEMNGFPV